jgi:hypothetical protein
LDVVSTRPVPALTTRSHCPIANVVSRARTTTDLLADVPELGLSDFVVHVARQRSDDDEGEQRRGCEGGENENDA